MAGKTILEQLKRAIADGDLEKAKILSLKLGDKPKPKPKPKINNDDNDDSDHGFITTSKREGGRKNETFKDEEGNVKTLSKKVPFSVVKNRKNVFKDDPTANQDDIEFDKKVNVNRKKPDYRESVTKVNIECSVCKSKFLVWPGEIMHNNWTCDDCIISRRR